MRRAEFYPNPLIVRFVAAPAGMSDSDICDALGLVETWDRDLVIRLMTLPDGAPPVEFERGVLMTATPLPRGFYEDPAQFRTGEALKALQSLEANPRQH